MFINMGCKFQDQGGIIIDEGALIGHNVVLATINHDLDPAKRQSMSYAPIHIGKNVLSIRPKKSFGGQKKERCVPAWQQGRTGC